jgi:hypothetical protein
MFNILVFCADGLQAPNSYHYETGKTQNVPKMIYGKNGQFQPQQPQQQHQYQQQPNQRGVVYECFMDLDSCSEIIIF